jgi:uncharacterized protein (TIGR02058 family)
MASKRIILEMGAGNDLHGGNYTKAAVRAVQDALHHSSLTFLRTLNIDKNKVDVVATIGVAEPGEIDPTEIAKQFPVGNITVNTVKGGLNVPDEAIGDVAVIASAAIEVWLRD